MNTDEYVKRLEESGIEGNTKQVAFLKMKLDMVNESIASYEEEIEARTALVKICSERPKVLEPKFEYEKQEAYWEASVRFYKVTKQREISEVNVQLLQAIEAKEQIEQHLKVLEGD